MKFLEKRSYRRAKNFSKFCKNIIEKNKKILDIGIGNGTIAKQIQKDHNAKIKGIDVIDYNTTDIPLIIYNGKKINFRDDSFDIVLIIEVLHHCDDMLSVLKEAKRVTKNKIIILEDIYTSKIHKIIMHLYDFIMNIRHPVNTPFNFKNQREWMNIFNKLNLKLVKNKNYPYNPFYCPMKTKMFVLEK